MKHALCLLLSTLLLSSAKAQIAPDFTLTDLDGTSHHLYEYLDAGKVVILDFYAVWCVPCQVNAPGVEAVYEAFGPDGSEQVVILGLEGDDDSTDEEVATFAVEYNTTNPQINDTEDVMDLYGIEYYPTYLVVCPDRSYQEYGAPTPDEIEVALTVGIELCAPLNEVDVDARIFSYNSGTTVCSEETTPNITLMNMGQLPLTSVDILVYLDGNLESNTPWSGDLELFDFDFVTLPSVDLAGMSAPEITVALENPNGQTDEIPENDTVTVGLEYGGEVFETAQVHFELAFDNFPQETSWEFLNSVGEVVAAGDDYMGYPDFSPPIDTMLELAPGDCYTFNIYDDFGDGICCAFADPGEGFWRISTEDGTLIAEGGVFEDQESAIFGIGGTTHTADHAHPQNNLYAYPNPTRGTLSFAATDASQWQLLGLDGRVLMAGTATGPMHTLDLAQLSASGTFVLRVTDASGKQSQQLLVYAGQ